MTDLTRTIAPFATRLRAAALAGLLVTTSVAAPAMLLAPAAEAQSTTCNAQLNRAAGALRAISTLRADFTQTDRNGQTLAGTLALRNPGRIRFQYTDANMLVVSNGRTLSVIDYEVQQVERWPIRNSPLGALLDPNRDISRYGRVVPTNSPGVISIRVDDPDRPERWTRRTTAPRCACATTAMAWPFLTAPSPSATRGQRPVARDHRLRVEKL
jgi:Outer membrane lipoprotein carrier protein LolA